MCFLILCLYFLLTILCANCQNSSSNDDYTSYTPPEVNLTSCIERKAVFSIANMRSGGLIYLRSTTGVYRVEPSFDTNGEVYIYQCDFDDCGIEWYVKFTFVSQRHANIQTGYDLHQTFICLADLVNISPGGGTAQESDSDNILRHWYRAAASMLFFDIEGTELESGSFVKLGTHVNIYINLTNNIGDMFDLTVKSCSMVLLPLIEERCPVDVDLIDIFTKLSVGYLYNNFSMFRPTTTVPGATDVLFSCTLEICRNPCPTYFCNGTEAILIHNGTERRKRQAGSRSRSLRLGTMFRVDYEDPVIYVPEEKCMETVTLIAVFTSLGVVLFVSFVSMLYYITEYQVKCTSGRGNASKLEKPLESTEFKRELTELRKQDCTINTNNKTSYSTKVTKKHYKSDSERSDNSNRNVTVNSLNKTFHNSHPQLQVAVISSTKNLQTSQGNSNISTPQKNHNIAGLKNKPVKIMLYRAMSAEGFVKKSLAKGYSSNSLGSSGSLTNSKQVGIGSVTNSGRSTQNTNRQRTSASTEIPHQGAFDGSLKPKMSEEGLTQANPDFDMKNCDNLRSLGAQKASLYGMTAKRVASQRIAQEVKTLYKTASSSSVKRYT